MMPVAQSILLLHAGATWFMTGVIWYVQVVHYPLMPRAERAGFAGFEAEHQRRTTWIVAPAMLLEAAAAVALAAGATPGVPRAATLAGLALLAGVWLATVRVQVPLHTRLQRGFDATTHRRLVRSNWVRTALWSMRAALAIGMIALNDGTTRL